MASTGLLRSRTRYDYKHVQGGVSLNYRDLRPDSHRSAEKPPPAARRESQPYRGERSLLRLDPHKAAAARVERGAASKCSERKIAVLLLFFRKRIKTMRVCLLSKSANKRQKDVPALEAADKKRVEELLQSINVHTSLPPKILVNEPTHLLSKRVIEDVWKQQTLLRLLQLIDVPLLEDILVSSVKAKPDCFGKEEDLIISNTFLDREVTRSLNLPELDKWLYAAVECLEYFPDQFIVMVSQQLPQSTNKPSSLSTYKKILFDIIIKYYSQKKDSLLDTQDLNIHSGIIELIEKGKMDQALEASQLYLKLLAPNIREELHRLLTFIAIASESEGYKLQKQFDNRLVIIKTCTKFILRNKTLSKPRVELLTQFLMDNHSELFKTPLTLLELTSRRFESLLEGQDPDIDSGFTFCQRVTTKEYEDQKQQTNQHLLALVQEIDNDPTIPLKQKKKLIKELRKYHSVIYCSGCKTTCEFCTLNG
ncbi:PREDICTED: DEP domain-containing protein 4 [Nipponia nippon]|uniref:DEP domain-containing protein 4 n=1 Tax=Nipponia nippon TaxID=128390 RepID=UPI000511A403|nr:PREDICTED: DEP domain-containing protein 4 [Nipponia nippon]